MGKDQKDSWGKVSVHSAALDRVMWDVCELSDPGSWSAQEAVYVVPQPESVQAAVQACSRRIGAEVRRTLPLGVGWRKK